jgi:hypothetical protein
MLRESAAKLLVALGAYATADIRPVYGQEMVSPARSVAPGCAKPGEVTSGCSDYWGPVALGPNGQGLTPLCRISYSSGPVGTVCRRAPSRRQQIAITAESFRRKAVGIIGRPGRSERRARSGRRKRRRE